jgi:hypothetical protein
MKLTGENRQLGGKPVPVPLCPPQISHGLDLGSNPGLRGERPATNRLSHGTACSYPSLRINTRLMTSPYCLCMFLILTFKPVFTKFGVGILFGCFRLDFQQETELLRFCRPKKFPCLFHSPNFHCLCHKNLPLVPILSQFCPLRIPSRYFGMSHFKTISVSAVTSSKCTISSAVFPTKIQCGFVISLTYIMPRPSHCFLFNHRIIVSGIQI